MDSEKDVLKEVPEKKSKKRITSRQLTIKITISAMMVALGVICSYITKFLPLRMPQGGSISFECLPLVLAGLFLGPVYGLITGVIYGAVDLMIDGVLYHWGSLFLDYLLAFGAVGLCAGFFKKQFYSKKFLAIFWATGLGFFFRYICSGLSGVLLFPEYADGKNVFFYSFILYNLPYMAASMGLTMAVLAATYIPLQKQTKLLSSWLR